MNLKKNLGAKIAAFVASLTALGGIWALVHQNPPTTASSATTDASPQAAPTTPGQRKPAIAKANPVQAQAPKPHTRTHTSRAR